MVSDGHCVSNFLNTWSTKKGEEGETILLYILETRPMLQPVRRNHESLDSSIHPHPHTHTHTQGLVCSNLTRKTIQWGEKKCTLLF